MTLADQGRQDTRDLFLALCGWRTVTDYISGMPFARGDASGAC